MKKIIQILLICIIIVGTIIIATIGLNVGLKYSENKQIDINIEKEFKIEDISQITKEIFKNKKVLIQHVELYKDMVQIIVEDVSEEQLIELNTKINEKYELNHEITDVQVTNNANVRLRDIVEPYIVPIIILSIITILITMFICRSLGIWKVLYSTVVNIVAPQAILFSIYAITRLPINRITPIVSIIVYIASITLNLAYINTVKEENIKTSDSNKK